MLQFLTRWSIYLKESIENLQNLRLSFGLRRNIELFWLALAGIYISNGNDSEMQKVLDPFARIRPESQSQKVKHSFAEEKNGTNNMAELLFFDDVKVQGHRGITC